MTRRNGTVRRVGLEVDAIDVFCGFGGSSDGIHAAGATVRAAANHNELALECHAKNFPETDHWHADLVDANDPHVLDRFGKKVPGHYLDPADLPAARFAWFSPSCTHHSQANATKIYERGYQLALLEDEDGWDEQQYVNSERSRVTMSCVLRYCDRNHPEIVVVENVLEVTKWGPGRDGSTFRWWLDELDKLGYQIKPLFLNSMFFGPCPQSRDRIYIVAWRKGNRAPDLDYRPKAYCTSDACSGRLVDAVQTWKPRTKAWMLDTWGKYLQQYDYRCPRCRAVVHPASWMALTAIDWSNLGPTLAEKIDRGDRPADATWERIRRAVAKYRNAPPIILPDGTGPAASSTVHVAHSIATDNQGSSRKYDANRSRHAAEHLPTLSQRNTVGLAVGGALMPIQSGRPRANHFATQQPTLVAGGNHQAIVATVKNYGGPRDLFDRAHYGADPLGTVTRRACQQGVIALVVPNRTHNTPKHAGEQLPPVMTSATEAVIVQAAGHTFERAGYTRARDVEEQLFTQPATNEFALATIPTLRGDHPQQAHPGEQLDTVSADGTHHALVTGLWTKFNGKPGDTAPHSVAEPFGTITAGGDYGIDPTGLIVVPWIDQWLSDPIYVTEQLATITARMRHSLAMIEPSDEPITDDMLLQVRFRMLQPDPELRRAMAFRDDYLLIGNKTQMTAGLGNAVTPPVASWITERCLATLDPDRNRVAA